MIKTIITMGVIGASLIGIPSTATYTKAEPEPLSVEELVSHYADQFGVNQELAHYIAFNESSYNPNAVGDMNITCPGKGTPVRARGVYQLTECWYGHVSDEEAFDPETNIKIAMEIIAKGEKMCRSQFSTCDRYYKNL